MAVTFAPNLAASSRKIRRWFSSCLASAVIILSQAALRFGPREPAFDHDGMVMTKPIFSVTSVIGSLFVGSRSTFGFSWWKIAHSFFAAFIFEKNANASS